MNRESSMNSEAKSAEPLDMGVVTISLDTELGWGRINTGEYDDVAPRLDGGRDAIRVLISLFERYRIPATWAIVGQLCRKGRAEEDDIRNLPTTDGTFPFDHDWWRAPDLVQQITDSPVDHEIGAHSGSHLLYDSISHEQALADLESFHQWIGSIVDTQATSFVFPQNRIGNLEALQEAGFRAFRGRPPILGSEPSPTAFLPRLRGNLVDIPASLAYRGYDGRNRILQTLPNAVKVEGMKWAVRHAAHRGRVCHVVLHPKDFTCEDGKILLDGLEQWLEFVAERRAAGAVEVCTMKNIAERVTFGVN